MINSSSRSNSACSANLCLACDHCPRQDNCIHTYANTIIYLGSRRVNTSYPIIHMLLENTLAHHLLNTRPLYSVINSHLLSQHLRQYFATDKRCITITDKYSLRQWVQCVNHRLS